MEPSMAICASRYEADTPNYLASGTDIQQRIALIRKDINQYNPAIHRVAVALYDSERDILKTFACDEDTPSGFSNYEAVLSRSESLSYLASHAKKRVLNNISIESCEKSKHSNLVRSAGYQSSLTIPLIIEGKLLGFLFANSRNKFAFDEEVTKHFQSLSMFLTLLLNQEQDKINILKSTVESMKVVNQVKDPETGEHLNRMARYSLIIAREVAPVFKLSDLQIRYIYLYAPLHDIGKLTIPDHILFKEGPLTSEEMESMKTHSANGHKLTQQILDIYKLTDIPFPETLTTIVRSHHEKLDGSGYPDGLVGEEIPVEARIVAVADIFDALTSIRPYKRAWSVEEAFSELRKLARLNKIDSHCVEALARNKDSVITTLLCYRDN